MQYLAKAGQVMGSVDARFYLENITFANTTASYSPAIYVVGSKVRIIDSKFINLKANITAGAMSLREGGELYIKNCEFINTTSSKNAGAVYVDITGYNPGNEGNVTIIDSKFKDVSSEFAGAYVQLGGQFWINNTEFINSHAIFNGGAVYLSFTETEINNCTFDSNGVEVIEGYPTYGGAIFSDISKLNITDSKFFNNVAGEGNAIYAYDSSFRIKGSTFKNNTNAIFTVFDKVCNIDASNVLNNDTVSTNNTFYATIIVGEGMQLTLVNNTIDVDTLPSKFDLRNWGWVSPVRDQGWMGACWTFGMTAALESALLKATGIPFNVSMNNMKTVMKYSPYGAMEVFEGGANLASVGYLLSWLGAIPYEDDTYDELGKITLPIVTDHNIHIQDMIFIPNNEIPNGTQIKLSVLKYGALDVSFFGQSSYDDETPYYNPKTYAQYVDLPETANHEVSIIGWDDNFPKEKFLMAPPGDGAWIVKNSYGTDWGDKGFLYVSYYDQSLLKYKPGKVTDYAAVPIIENTVPYNKNYQYDITWLSNFNPSNGTISYMNAFEALDDDLIAAVGTYFNESGASYTVKIFVNDELKLTQEGVSPYVGYHTIKLDSYIPIKKGDVFKAAITSNWAPHLLLEDTRVHYTQNISFISFDGKTWKDAYDLGYIACLKVYTVDEGIKHNTTIIAPDRIVGVNDAIYGYDYQFILKDENGTALANKEVQISFNGKNQTVTTDEKGWGTAKVKADTEGTYDVEVTFEGDNGYCGISQSASIKLIRQKTSFVAPDRTVYVRDMSRGYSY
ncbi:C1 family peptidase, partial [Methanobrevibacter sp.]|uniref:C1 family peptidase n=1 Tax=Methanobrevibacter sp. TaxID=66852 RepID=UPI00386CE21D